MSKTAEEPGESVPALLGRLDRWLGRHRRDFAKHLPPGASAAELAGLQKRLGGSLPAGLGDLLSWHNGQGDDFIGAFEESWLLMSCQAVAAAKNDLEADDAAGWNQAWVPFLDNDAGDFLFLDTAQAGHPVRSFCLGDKEHARVAASLADWLHDFVANVEQGHYHEDPERGQFMRSRP